MENRLSCRYQPGPGYGLQINVLVSGQMHETTVLNMSGFGVGLLLPPGVFVVVNETIRVFFMLGSFGVETEARVAHKRTRDDGTVCGVELKFKDVATHQAYLQFFQPVEIGQSLELKKPTSRGRAAGGVRYANYLGASNSILTVFWGEKPEEKLQSFALRMHGYWFEADCNAGTLTMRRLAPPDLPPEQSTQTVKELTEAQRRDGHRLLAEVTVNLSDNVPPEVRRCFEQLVARHVPNRDISI